MSAVAALAAWLLLAAGDAAPAPEPPAAPPGAPDQPGAGPAVPAPPAQRPAGRFTRPAQVDPGCVQRSIRIPAAAVKGLPASAQVKFAVRLDGSVIRFEVLTPGLDQRVGDAIRKAAEGCAWNPGTDEQGRPANIWVVMPIQFKVH